MISEENLFGKDAPQVKVSNDSLILLLYDLIKQTVPNFKSYIKSDNYTKRNLNEDDFTQIFVEQAQIVIRKHDYPFNIGNQYRDITYLSRGHSDFYFYPNEQGISTTSIFSVESKRLPSPAKLREKEYVIGNNNNGGIERYKTEKHGRGLNQCGLLGFIEELNSDYWLTTINSWIGDLSTLNNTWHQDEILKESEHYDDYYYLKSIAHRQTSTDIILHHIWIDIATR